MAKKRKFAAYRNTQVPYTRTSKYREKSFIRMSKNPRVVRYEMGNKKKEYPYYYDLVSKQKLQIRDHALESCRTVVNKPLNKTIGTENYFFHIKIFPHHIMRENPLASGAGADRLSTGMKMSFGKPIGIAAIIREGQTIMRVYCNKKDLETVKTSLNKGKTKLPGNYEVRLQENK